MKSKVMKDDSNTTQIPFPKLMRSTDKKEIIFVRSCGAGMVVWVSKNSDYSLGYFLRHWNLNAFEDLSCDQSVVLCNTIPEV